MFNKYFEQQVDAVSAVLFDNTRALICRRGGVFVFENGIEKPWAKLGTRGEFSAIHRVANSQLFAVQECTSIPAAQRIRIFNVDGNEMVSCDIPIGFVSQISKVENGGILVSGSSPIPTQVDGGRTYLLNELTGVVLPVAADCAVSAKYDCIWISGNNAFRGSVDAGGILNATNPGQAVVGRPKWIMPIADQVWCGDSLNVQRIWNAGVMGFSWKSHVDRYVSSNELIAASGIGNSLEVFDIVNAVSYSFLASKVGRQTNSLDLLEGEGLTILMLGNNGWLSLWKRNMPV